MLNRINCSLHGPFLYWNCSFIQTYFLEGAQSQTQTSPLSIELLFKAKPCSIWDEQLHRTEPDPNIIITNWYTDKQFMFLTNYSTESLLTRTHHWATKLTPMPPLLGVPFLKFLVIVLLQSRIKSLPELSQKFSCIVLPKITFIITSAGMEWVIWNLS